MNNGIEKCAKLFVFHSGPQRTLLTIYRYMLCVFVSAVCVCLLIRFCIETTKNAKMSAKTISIVQCGSMWTHETVAKLALSLLANCTKTEISVFQLLWELYNFCVLCCSYISVQFNNIIKCVVKRAKFPLYHCSN